MSKTVSTFWQAVAWLAALGSELASNGVITTPAIQHMIAPYMPDVVAVSAIAGILLHLHGVSHDPVGNVLKPDVPPQLTK